jgi:hypothetical protein
MADVAKNLDRAIAHAPEVKRAVLAVGRAVEARARARLAGHRRTGAARIEAHREDTDYVIELVDDAALSIEFGRSAYTRDDGVEVGAAEPLSILRGAI